MSMPHQRSAAARGGHPAPPSVRGYILLPVSIGITLIATVALLLNIESVNDAMQAGSELQTSQVQYVAEAGFTHASWYAQNNVCSGSVSFQHELAGHGHYTAQLDSGASVVNHYTLPVVSDTYIEERDPDQVRGNQSEIHIGNDHDQERRGLFRFDLSTIPEAEHIVEAIAWFYVTKYESDSALAIHAITDEWTEAGATWSSMADSIGPARYASISPQAQGTWVAVNLTGLAQSWLNVADSNHGLFVVLPDQSSESRVAAKEADPGLRPRLEVITADGAVSPLQLTMTATLTGKSGPADDVSRSLMRSGITAYQSPVAYNLQPDADTGKDTMLEDWKPSQNNGESRWLEVSYGSGKTSHSMLQFTLAIPAGAKIESAVLSLNLNTVRGRDAVANVQRVTSAWEEGSGNNGSGASWLSRDGVRLWDDPGGDMDQRLFASTAIGAGETGWASWDISDLVQGWVNGTYPNYGLALVPASVTTDLRFYSSDVSVVARRPTLQISYRCECGNPCLAPKGSGNILMVVGNATNLSSSDTLKKARFQSWGYGVTPISDSASPMAISSAASSNDVIFVSESVSATELGEKLTDLSTGIVSEAGGLNGKLGMATSHEYAVSSTINISDNGHFVSALFPIGELALYTGAMEQQVIAGGVAMGLEELGDTAGQGSLAILETGASLGGERTGESAAGRRVLLPLGRATGLDWNLIHGNGLLLVQRAIAWAQQTD